MKNLTWILALAGLGIGLLLGGCADLDLSAAGRRIAETRTVRVTGAVVNLRAGPGLDHAVLGQVQAGDRLPVTGRTASGAWLHVTPAGHSRWIYGDLTNIETAVRQALPVLPGPPAAALSTPTTATPPLTAAEIMYHPPGSYDRALHKGLQYEWELVFTDNSELWDWEVADFKGCYDAMRVVMDDIPEQRGLKRLEIVLSDPFVARDLLSYNNDAHHTLKLNVYYPTRRMDREALFRAWPDWHAGNLPHPDFAYVSSICLPSDTAEEQVCRLHPMWGNEGSANLDGAAASAMTRSAAISSLRAGGSYRAWLDSRYAYNSYLLPLDTHIGDPAGQGPCLRLKKR